MRFAAVTLILMQTVCQTSPLIAICHFVSKEFGKKLGSYKCTYGDGRHNLSKLGPRPAQTLISRGYFFLSARKFSRPYKKKFITNFVIHVTNFVIHVRKFVIHVTNFVTKTFCADSKNHQVFRKNPLGLSKKLLL